MNLLLIEDDKRVAKLIQKGLQEANYNVFYNSTIAHSEAIITNENIALVITDILLPDGNGLDFSKTIRRKFPDIPIIMLTALGTTDDKLQGFDSGADDYLVKPFEMRELLARIKALLKRSKQKIKNTIIKYDELEINLATKTVKRESSEIDLTPKEFKLLQFLLENPERVLSRQEISEKVWDMNFDTGTNFIDVYINYIRKKVDKNFPYKLIHTKTGMGFILKRIK